jgi:hypothetical protein
VKSRVSEWTIEGKEFDGHLDQHATKRAGRALGGEKWRTLQINENNAKEEEREQIFR